MTPINGLGLVALRITMVMILMSSPAAWLIVNILRQWQLDALQSHISVFAFSISVGTNS